MSIILGGTTVSNCRGQIAEVEGSAFGADRWGKGFQFCNLTSAIADCSQEGTSHEEVCLNRSVTLHFCFCNCHTGFGADEHVGGQSQAAQSAGQRGVQVCGRQNHQGG